MGCPYCRRSIAPDEVTNPCQVPLRQQLLYALFCTRIEFHDPSYCLLWIAVSGQGFEVFGQQPVAMIRYGEEHIGAMELRECWHPWGWLVQELKRMRQQLQEVKAIAVLLVISNEEVVGLTK